MHWPKAKQLFGGTAEGLCFRLIQRIGVEIVFWLNWLLFTLAFQQPSHSKRGLKSEIKGE
jgi:hypothetical protein